jgi:hypothetical protein
VVTLLAVAVPAFAYWTASAAGESRATAGNLPAGAQPTATLVGSRIIVGWAQSSITGLGVIGGLAGGGYTVTRYADGSTTPVAPLSACNGVIAGSGATLTCAENAVPDGRWRYSITPRLNQWVGVVSPFSASVLVDLTAPTTTATLSPAPNAAGWVRTPVTVSLAAVDNPNGSGVASIRYGEAGAQALPQTTYAAPFTVTAPGLTTVSYAATDKAGNVEATKTSVIRLDSIEPTGSIVAPAAGSSISGQATVTSSSADALSGVASAAFQISPTGSGVWTTFGTAALAPWRAVVDSTTVPDGAYQLRVVTTDWAGNGFASPAVDVVVDNNRPTGIDIQGSNGGLAGTLDAGDKLTYTFSESMAPGSILAGWTGAPTAVTVSVSSSRRSGTQQTVLGVALGTVNLGPRAWTRGRRVRFAATMTLTSPNVVTVTVSSCVSSCRRVSTGVGAATFTWTPSSGATDLAGNPVSTTTVTETGGPKQNF